MFGQFLVTFREALEAALITAIVLSYLARSGKASLSRYVLYGVVFALVASLGLGAFVWFVYGSLPEAAQLLFEAVAAFLAVAVLSSMICWMATKGSHIGGEMEKRLDTLTTRGAVVGFVTLGFVVVFREGAETVLFLTTYLVQDAVSTVVGMLLGIAAAGSLAYLVFAVGIKISLRRFFYFTSVMLVLLAGGLVGYGVHELLEYSETVGVNTGWFSAPAFNLNIASDSPFHHKGLVGSVFAVLFGYTVQAEWARVIVHLVYLATAFPLVFWMYARQEERV